MADPIALGAGIISKERANSNLLQREKDTAAWQLAA
jgi:hypothetical protein